MQPTAKERAAADAQTVRPPDRYECPTGSVNWPPGTPSSAASRRLDGGDVDLLHRHHRLERALGLSATGRQRLGQRPRRDLPGEPPAVLAPTARAFLTAIGDNCIPVAVRLRLIVRGDL